MRVFITGMQGTLGLPLSEELISRGHDVGGCDLQHSSNSVCQRADVANHRQLKRVLDDFGPDVVYHLAAEFGRLNGDHFPEQLWMTNAVGLRNLLYLQRDGDFKIIFSSSSEIYGEHADTPFLYEDLSNRVVLYPQNDYAISKMANELQIRNHLQRHPTPGVMVLRFFNAYGPGEYYHPYRSVCCLFVYRALHGLPYTVYRDYHRVFMYIDDFIPTLANCCERFQSGRTVNIGGLEYRSVEFLNDVVSAACGLDPHRPEVQFMDLDAHNTVNKRPDVSRAHTELDHSPSVSLLEGIPRTVEWMRGVYSL